MTVYSKRNIILPGPDGQKFRLKKDCIGPVPEWAEKSAYLKALAADKKVVITEEAKKPKEKPAGEKKPADEKKPEDSGGGEK